MSPAAPSIAADLTLASDLSRDAAQARASGIPLLVLFSLPECDYCERVRREFLLPIQRPRNAAPPAILRQVNLGSGQPLRDFAGETITHDAFARRHSIAFAPTIKIFDAEGKEAAEPLIGLLTPDLYGAYLENALEKGRVRMNPGSRE